jgi:hypothetical protein
VDIFLCGGGFMPRSRPSSSPPTVTLSALKHAHSVFQGNEPRDLFYKAATELINLALDRKTSLSVDEALAVLLQTWNREYYRFRKFDDAHFESIERLCREHQRRLATCRTRTIDSLAGGERLRIVNLFQEFETVLGPVGAAKALHLLGPNFFPLWDRAIAKAFGLSLAKSGSNGQRYWSFMLDKQRRYRKLSVQLAECPNVLKWIDEYNYCKYTKGWIS